MFLSTLSLFSICGPIRRWVVEEVRLEQVTGKQWVTAAEDNDLKIYVSYYKK